MEALIIFDSNFGNTREIANTIARQFGPNAAAINVSDFKQGDLQGVKLLIIGSPINAWQPTKKIKEFLKRFNPGELNGIKAAAFDTRVKSFISGNAAKKISKAKTGASIIVPPVGFYVNGNEGPLLHDETKRAGDWAGLIKSKL